MSTASASALGFGFGFGFVLVLGCSSPATRDSHAPPSSKAPAQTSALPAGGLLVASRTDRRLVNYPGDPRPDVFTVSRVAETGAGELLHDDGTTVTAFGWLDHHTLLVYREDPHSGDGQLERIVDGVAGEPLDISITAWNLAAPAEGVAELVVTKHGEIWLARPHAALRIDTPRFSLAAHAPSDVVRDRIAQEVGPNTPHFDPTVLPVVPAPPHYSVALFEVPQAKRHEGIVSYEKGWRCTGPGTEKYEWPFDNDWVEIQNVPQFRPRSLRWVSITPPRYLLEGDATNVNGTKTWLRIFDGCAQAPLDDVRWLGGDMWAELVGETWSLRLGGRVVGTVAGAGGWLAVQPP